MIYVSGTTGYDYTTMDIPDDVAAQTRNTLDTIARTLAEAGATLRDVVAVRYFSRRPGRHGRRSRHRRDRSFADICPAATMVMSDLIRAEMDVRGSQPDGCSNGRCVES